MKETNLSGHEALWMWFGLSRASWLTIPRVLMHGMPDAWQADMARLLNEYEQAYPNQPDLLSRVQVTDLNGKLVKTPEWLVNYRHPDRGMILAMRGEQEKK